MKFTRQPKVHELVRMGVPLSALPVYFALSDYADNKSGLCYPKMETIAHALRIHVRTVQRHLHLLRELGLVQFVERRRDKKTGKYLSWVYRLVLIPLLKKAKSTGQRRGTRLYKSLNKRTLNTKTEIEKREEEAARRREDFEWWFGD